MINTNTISTVNTATSIYTPCLMHVCLANSL